jgi:hypothetical protein
VPAKDLQLVNDDARPGIGAYLPPDPNRVFIGRQVMLMTKGHKHYRGIIRDILNDGFALVELEATLSRIRIKLQNLAITYGDL